MISASVSHGLETLSGLRAGRSQARESEGVKPLLEAHIHAIQPFVSRQIWAMVQLQLLTGARPGEIVGLRNGMIDRSGKVWTARLEHHKTEHKGKVRTLYFGPKAQEILRPWLLERPIGAFLFSPKQAEAERHAKADGHRRPDQRPDPRKTERIIGEFYSRNSYNEAIRGACDRYNAKIKAEETPEMKIPRWHVNQLRHTAATRIRQGYSLDAAQVALGHASADVTQIYAEADAQKAIAIFDVPDKSISRLFGV